jgi:pimeloyl-ACP methyl ester carboxylesterase
MKATKIVYCLTIALVSVCTGNALASESGTPLPIPTIDAAASVGYFYVGGRYVGDRGAQVMQGAMYVEVLRPKHVVHRYPLVLIHGAGQTGTNWLGTPDGRQGWAQYFLMQGYVIYIVDQPARGRSAWHRGVDGELKSVPASVVEKLFTAPEESGAWPQAKKHTRWPGEGPLKGRMGDPVFDAFYSTQVESLASNAETQELAQSAGAALLDRIGPAILLTHSQAGAFGWLIADARPTLVKGIIAVEPFGPPFRDAVLGDGRARPWGLADIALTYDPSVAAPEEINIVQQKQPDAPDLYACWLQTEPARRLPNLTHIPIMVVTSEASYHAVYDHCTVRYLRQVGAQVDFVRLEGVGIHGNGHMMMLETNNTAVASIIARWAARSIRYPSQ